MTRSQPCVTGPSYHWGWLTSPCGEQIPQVNLWLWHVPAQKGLSIAPSLAQKRCMRNNGHFSSLITLQSLFVLLWVFLWPCLPKGHLSCDCSFRRFYLPTSKANSESFPTIAEDKGKRRLYFTLGNRAVWHHQATGYAPTSLSSSDQRLPRVFASYMEECTLYGLNTTEF